MLKRNTSCCNTSHTPSHNSLCSVFRVSSGNTEWGHLLIRECLFRFPFRRGYQIALSCYVTTGNSKQHMLFFFFTVLRSYLHLIAVNFSCKVGLRTGRRDERPPFSMINLIGNNKTTHSLHAFIPKSNDSWTRVGSIINIKFVLRYSIIKTPDHIATSAWFELHIVSLARTNHHWEFSHAWLPNVPREGNINFCAMLCVFLACGYIWSRWFFPV